MGVIEQYKYQLHFLCAGCGHAWVVGHHNVTLAEPCPRWFCAEEPVENYSYERSPRAQREPAAAAPKSVSRRAIKPAA
jgi:hypothetical protein